MGVDDELYRDGKPFYWQVRLAVVYDAPVAAADQLFSEKLHSLQPSGLGRLRQRW